MRLDLPYLRKRLPITQWLQRSVLSFSFCPVSVNQTASYCSSRRANRDYGQVFLKSECFGNHLFLDGEVDENRVISPMSFQVLLSFLAAGSRGYTRRQLLNIFDSNSVDCLNFLASQISDSIFADGDPAVGPRMRCSNSLWLDQSLTLKPSFKQILDSDYRAALNPVAFQTKASHVRQQIDSWVENETSGLVKDFICEGSLNNSVKLFFTNALYFKGAWHGEGPPPSISKEDWRSDNFVAASVMTAKRRQFSSHDNGSHLVVHPFAEQSEAKRKINMLFRYPGAFVTENLMDVRGQMTPKFNVYSEVEASSVLRQLGVISPFFGGELTEMLSCFDGGELYVFNIFQKTFMETNEQGTEAATATAAIVMSGCPPDLPPLAAIEHEGCLPFLLYFGTDSGGLMSMAKTELVVSRALSPLPS